MKSLRQYCRKMWTHSTHASREALVLGIIACCCIVSLLVLNHNDRTTHNHNRLLAHSHSYSVTNTYGRYSLLFAHDIPLLGNAQFQAIGRLNAAEHQHLRKTLHATHIIRSFSNALNVTHLSDQQKESYGFDNPVKVSSPGQHTWTLGSGLDGHGYAYNESHQLFQLDRDLAALLNRDPRALRSTTLGIPHNIQDIRFQSDWSLLHAYGVWWIQEQGTALPAAQDVCHDWLEILTDAQAISFTTTKKQQSSPYISIRGKDAHGRRQIDIYDRGTAHGSREHRVIERREQIGEHTLIESFIISSDSLNSRSINMPQRVFVSEKMFPIPFSAINSIQLNKLHLQHTQELWYVVQADTQHTYLANQQHVNRFLNQLTHIPASTTHSEKIGTLHIHEAHIDIFNSPQLAAHSHYHNYMFTDTRLFPELTEFPASTAPATSTPSQQPHIRELVIQPTAGVPRIFSQLDDGTWDIDPEESAITADFIAAISAARVTKWTQQFQPQHPWTSTLTVAIGDGYIRLHKDDHGLIGIPKRNIQGYLDPQSAADVFGDDGDDAK